MIFESSHLVGWIFFPDMKCRCSECHLAVLKFVLKHSSQAYIIILLEKFPRARVKRGRGNPYIFAFLYIFPEGITF